MGTFTFRWVTRDDFGLLARWLAEPHVERWWNHEYTPDAVERDFGPTVDRHHPAEDFIALLDGEPIGVIQYCRLHDWDDYIEELAPHIDVPDEAVSIDYLIGDPVRIGKGIGTAMVRAFVERIWQVDPAATCVIVPVNSSNPASWKALIKAGFRLIARGEIEPDNPIDAPMHEILRLDRPS
jgi:aminoglycoside 6'-N-acetyltransferase